MEKILQDVHVFVLSCKFENTKAQKHARFQVPPFTPPCIIVVKGVLSVLYTK